MTIRVESLVDAIDAAPGELVTGQLRLTNEAAVDQTVTIHVIGLDAAPAPTDPPLPSIRVPAGESTVVDVLIAVPATLGVGQHAAAFEASVDRADRQPTLCPFTLSIASLERVHLSTAPTTIRGRGRAKFALDVTNNEPQPVGFVLDGAAPGVRLRFEEDSFWLVPGEMATTRAKVRGPRRLVGERVQHNILITARGRASSTSATVPYIQRPLLAARLRTVVAAVAVIALWLAGLAGVLIWQQQRQQDALDAANAPPTTVVDGSQEADGSSGDPGDSGTTDPGAGEGGDTPGDAGPDSGQSSDSGDPGAGTTGDSSDSSDSPGAGDEPGGDAPDGSGGSGSDAVPGGDAPGGSGADEPGSTGDSAGSASDRPAAASTPVSTSVTGIITIDTDEGQSLEAALSGVVVKLRELELGAPPPAQSTPLGFAAARSRGPTKIWSARYDPAPSELGRLRQTEPVVKQPDGQGVWLFTDVGLQRTYELAFQKVGFQTQSFVIEPTDDGSIVEVNVRLEPGEGSIDGVVVGPPAGQRNAEILVTDGTLSYVTTGDSETGGWRVEGLSTPAVYTMIATLPGYGTVVQQVTLAASEADKPVEIELLPGLATIRGKVFGPAGPLGGATITLAVGDVTRTTTTNTEGDVGSYSVPGLEIDADNPQSATIRAELDGFRTESTRRTVDRSDISGVNFLMTGDTLRLSGVIRSAEDGNPVIQGAEIELTTGDLTFTAQTGGGADSGRFTVGDLPPGDYLIAVSHFEHETSYRSITLTDGGAPPVLDVVLTTKDLNAAAALLRGDLVIRVIDLEGKNQADREVEGATADLTFVATSESVPPLPPNDSSNEITYNKIPIGTYQVVVRHPDYNTAPSRNVTVGLDGETIEVILDKKVRAGGRVIDSVSGRPLELDEFSVQVFHEPREPDATPIAVEELDGGEWKTATSLELGQYSVDVDAEGYRVRPDQVLDTTLNGSDRFMRFEIRTALTRELEVNEIRADPYAKILGRVFRPTVDGAGTVRLAPIDEPALAVAVACDGRTANPGDVVLTDELPVGAATTGLFDTYEAGRAVFEAEQIGGAECTIDVSAGAAYTPAEQVTLSNVRVSDGSSLTDRVVNVALAKPPLSDFTGTVFWVDPRDGQPHRLPAVEIETVGAGAITGFTPSIAGPLQNELEPKPVVSNLNAKSDANGLWEIGDQSLRQIVGRTTYQFKESDRFGSATISVTIDEDGNRTVSAIDGAKVTPPGPDGRYGIELLQIKPGALSGTVRILTTATTKRHGEVVVTPYPPAQDPATGTPDPPPFNLSEPTFIIPNAAAGTWTVDFALPKNHEFFGTAPNSVSGRVDPDVVNDSFDTTLVELGEVDLTWASTNPAVPVPKPTATLTGGQVLAVCATTDPCRRDAASGVPYEVLGFPVDVDVTVSPEIYVETTHTVGFEVPGFDGASARLTVDDVCPSDLPAPGSVQTGADAVTLTFKAGQTRVLCVEIPPHGGITGTIVGRSEAGAEVPLDLRDPDNPTSDDATVLVESVDRLTGATGPTDVEAVPGTVSGTFSLTGPPGVYKITVAHPRFETAPIQIPADTPPLIPPVPPGSFEMVNNTPKEIADNWILKERTSFLEVEVTSSEPNVDVTLTAVDTGLGLPPIPKTIPSGTPTTIGGLAPLVEYEVRIESPGTFPAVARVVAPPTTNSVDGTVKLVAVLPTTVNNVIVEVSATNSAGVPVELPDPWTQIAVSTFYDELANPITIDEVGDSLPPTTTENLATAADRGFGILTAVITETVSGGAASAAEYTFAGLPTGLHTVTVEPTTVTGYEDLNPTQYDISIPGTTGPLRLEYRAEDVTVVAQLATGDDYELTGQPGVAWTLTSTNQGFKSATWTGSCAKGTSGDPCAPLTASFDANNNTLTISGVPPEPGQFTLTIDDDLHAPTSFMFPVAIAGGADGTLDGTENVGPFTPTADKAILRGTVEQIPLPGTRQPLDGSGVVRLIPDSNTDCSTANAPPPPNYTGNPNCEVTYTGIGTYEQFVDATTLASGDEFKLEVSNSGYQTETSPSVTLTAGTVTPLNVTINALAVIDVSVVKDLVGNEPVTAPGLAVVLQDTAGTRYHPTNNANPYRFNVPGGIGYWVEISATDYPTPLFGLAPNGFIFPVEIGQQITRNVAIPRVVNVTGSIPAAATLTATLGGTSIVKTSTPYRFEFPTSVGTANGIVRITAPGYRTREIPVNDVTGQVIANVSVDLYQFATVSGTVNVPASTPYRVYRDGVEQASGSTFTGSTFTDGSTVKYSVSGLDAGPNGEQNEWRVEFDVLGVGVGQVVLEVRGENVSDQGGANPTTDTSIVRNLTLTPRNVAVTITVRDSAGALLDGASVEFDDAFTNSTTSTTNGVATFNIPENLSSTAFTVSLGGYITAQRTSVPTFPNNLADITVADVTLYQLTGTVKNGAAPVDGATVDRCPTSGGCPNPPTDDTDANGVFLFGTAPAPGSYTLKATKKPANGPNLTGELPITINSDGTITPGTATGTLTIAIT